jgi:hypothetical protein
MAKGVRLGGPRGVAWAVGWSGGRASYPCSRKMRREDRGKTRWGGPVGEGDRGGHAGEAAGPFWPLPSPEGTRPLSPGPMAGGSFGVGAPKRPCRPGGAGCFRLSLSEHEGEAQRGWLDRQDSINPQKGKPPRRP